MSLIGWSFPHNNHGVAAGSNDSAIDAFAGNKLSSVVREIIQNSLDARKDDKQPVSVCFKLDWVDNTEFDGFRDIKPHLSGCLDIVKEGQQDLKDVAAFYKNGIKEISKSPKVAVFSAHDYNTKGLEGPLDKSRGSWFALIKGAGVSQKPGQGSLGSFGHGSKAPFAFSRIRSIFYFSRIEEKGQIRDRFQGKSILQSHEDPDKPTELTQGTGFYGHKERLMPLLDKDVPTWARELREEVTRETGTSIFVPYTSFSENLYSGIERTVIANFFYAIETEALEVTVGNALIYKGNWINRFKHCEKILENEPDETNVDHVKDCFKSINTIIKPDHESTQQIPGFGNVFWSMRISEELEKKVGLARSSGMLITRSPHKLKRFTNVKPFDMFICVQDQEGSEFLKKLENPTHDNFQFDRLGAEESRRKKAEHKYDLFCKRIRMIIESYAKMDNLEEEEVSELGFLFSEVSDVHDENTGKIERGNKILIKDGPSKRKSPFTSGTNPSPIGDGDEWGGGLAGGNREIKNKGGNNKTPKGTTPIQGTVAGGDVLAGAKHVVWNLRANHYDKSKKKARLYFDSPLSGPVCCQVAIVGENGSEPVRIIIDGKPVSGVKIEAIKSKRYNLDLEFENSVHSSALEATIAEEVTE